MPHKETALASAIESVVGHAHVTQKPALTIDGVKPKLLARPGSAEEVAACLRICSEFAASVVPAGRMTWLECGNPLRSADVVLSVERMRRIIEYSPPDLTATVEAGVGANDFRDVTNRQRQWLPLDPPGFRTASLGAVAACNSSGPLRMGFGIPRDYVIGLKLAHADGTESRSGGRVVKNVAGYDMNKLYIGSYGTLAIITELTVKLRPLTERNSTILISSNNRAALFQFANRVLTSELQPASIVLATRVLSLMDDALLIRFIDSEPSVASQVEWVMQAVDENSQATVLSNDDAEKAWERIADLDEPPIRLRISVPLSAVPAVFEKVFAVKPYCAAAVDIGAGIIRMAFAGEDSAADRLRQMRTEAAGFKGTMTVEKGSAELRREVDAWGDIGPTAELMRSIKAGFDPQSILNPGKYVSGI